jgi:hypothetical protein
VNDELQRRINEHVLNGDAPSIIWAMEGQIRINTQLEAKLAELAELERREALLTERVLADMELDSALAVPDRWPKLDDGRNVRVLNARYRKALARDALTDAGFPWTEDPVPAAEPEGEFGACDECGEPLMFASMSTCASCAWSHER